MRVYFFHCLIILIFGSSCSVEKRVHLSGYNIKWHSKRPSHNQLSSKKTNSKKIDEINFDECDTLKDHRTTGDDHYQNITASTENDEIITYGEKKLIIRKEETLNDNKIENQISIKRLKNDGQKELNEEEGTVNKLALWSFISILFYWLVVPIFLSWFLGAKALNQFKRGIGGTKGKWMAIVGFSYGSLFWLAMATIFTYYGLTIGYLGGIYFLAIAAIFIYLFIRGFYIINKDDN